MLQTGAKEDAAHGHTSDAYPTRSSASRPRATSSQPAEPSSTRSVGISRSPSRPGPAGWPKWGGMKANDAKRLRVRDTNQWPVLRLDHSSGPTHPCSAPGSAGVPGHERPPAPLMCQDIGDHRAGRVSDDPHLDPEKWTTFVRTWPCPTRKWTCHSAIHRVPPKACERMLASAPADQMPRRPGCLMLDLNGNTSAARSLAVGDGDAGNDVASVRELQCVPRSEPAVAEPRACSNRSIVKAFPTDQELHLCDENRYVVAT